MVSAVLGVRGEYRRGKRKVPPARPSVLVETLNVNRSTASGVQKVTAVRRVAE